MARVVCVGSALRDRLLSVSNLPEPDGGAFVTDETSAFGGVAANVACGLERLGHDAAVVSRLGDDADGRAVRDDLDDWGVDADGVRLVDGERSSYSLVLRDDDGQRMIVAGGESVQHLSLTDADRERLRGADVAFTSAYVPDAVIRELVAMRRDGALDRLAFDLAGPFEELEGRGGDRETVDEVVGVADCVVLAAVAARSYLDCGPREAASRLAERGVARAAVTDGDQGAYLTAGGDPVHVPPVDVDVVDATGAGDAFTAGLLHAWLLAERSLADAGGFAAAAAAANCRGMGAREALPTVDDVESLR
jgi:sugar/nucleoside kinase (ribokinase family)